MLSKYLAMEQESGLVPSLEAIDFQFDEKRVGLLVDACAALGNDFSEATANDILPPVIKELCGLNIDFKTENNVNAGVYHPTTIKNNPLYGDFIKELGLTSDVSLRKAVRKNKAFWMAVDRRTGQIKGTPAEIKHTMVLGGGIFSDDTTTGKTFTARMRAAVLGHEIGHLISFYEWAHRAATTNFLLSGFTEALTSSTDTKERITIIKKNQGNGLLNGIEADLLKAKNGDEVRILVYNSEVSRSRRDLGTDVYDTRNWEALADQYVSRLGLGLALAQAGNAFFEKSTSVYIGMAMSSIVTVCVMSSALSAGPLAIIALGVFSYVMSGQDAGVYDDGKKRIELIRKELIQRMKAASDRESKQAILVEIDEVEKIIENFADYRSLLSFIGGTFFPYRREQYRKISAQKLLEDFSASELNVAAQRLEA